jgi:hypothetical protein
VGNTLRGKKEASVDVMWGFEKGGGGKEKGKNKSKLFLYCRKGKNIIFVGGDK